MIVYCYFRIVKEVTSQMILRIENVFEDINNGKRLINDFLAEIEIWKDWLPTDWTEVIQAHQTNLMDAELQIQRQIALLLEQIRRGGADEVEMGKLLNKFNTENPCCLSSIKQFLKANARIEAKINALGRLDQNITENGRDKGPKQPNTDILLKKIISLGDLIDKYYDDNVYLLHISHQWEEKDKANWYKQLRCFNNLRQIDMKNEEKKSIFRVIDHDLHPDLDDSPSTSVIYHGFQGTIKSKDYYHTSLSKFHFVSTYDDVYFLLATLTPKQVREIRMENKFSNLSDRDIETRHKKFIEAQ